MSAEGLAWAFKTYAMALTPTARLLVTLLGDSANEDGFFPPATAKRLAVLLSTSRTTIRKALEELERAGLVQILRREARGGKLPSAYFLPFKHSSMAALIVALRSEGDDESDGLADEYEALLTLGQKVAKGVGNPEGSLTLDLLDSEASSGEGGLEGRRVEGGGGSRRRDPVWDAIVEETGYGSNGARGRIAKAKQAIVKDWAAEGGDPASLPVEIRARAAMYRSVWPDAALTPNALSAHFSALPRIAGRVGGDLTPEQIVDLWPDVPGDLELGS